MVQGASYTKDIYPIGTSDTQENNYIVAVNKYGDAVYETSSNYKGNTSWYSVHSYFPYSTQPFFICGSRYSEGEDTGVFWSSDTDGGGYFDSGFRPVLIVF